MTEVHDTTNESSRQDRSLLFIKQGNILLIQNTDKNRPAVDDSVFEILHSHLSYTKKEFLYGAAAYDRKTGKKRRMEFTDRRLYSRDSLGRLFTNFGFLRRCYDLLKSSGYCITYFDWDKQFEEKHPRPDRYKSNMANVSRCFEYRPKQPECLQAIHDSPHGVVHAITGFGKRIMIVMVCLMYPHAKIHIVIRGVPLVNQMVAELTRVIPNIGQIGGGKKHFGDRITVFTRDSLAHSDFDADILIGDEAHELTTDESTPMLASYQRSRNFAFTATPEGRSDGSDPRLEAFFGPRIFYLPYWEGVELGLVVPIRVEWTDVILGYNPAEGLEDVARQRHGIWFNDARNDIIAKDIAKTSQSEQFLVLTDTVYHAVELYRRAIQQERERQLVLIYDKIDTERFGRYKESGDLPKGMLKMTAESKEQYRKMFEAGEIDAIATKTWEVGIDPVYLQNLFVAGSFRSEIKSQQAPGRASRINKAGKEVGIVRDYRDQFDAGFHAASKERYRVYGSLLRWEQVLDRGDGSFTPL